METSNDTNKIFVLVQKPCEQQLHQEVKNFYIQYCPYSSITFYNGPLLIVIFCFFVFFTSGGPAVKKRIFIELFQTLA